MCHIPDYIPVVHMITGHTISSSTVSTHREAIWELVRISKSKARTLSVERGNRQCTDHLGE